MLILHPEHRWDIYSIARTFGRLQVRDGDKYVFYLVSVLRNMRRRA